MNEKSLNTLEYFKIKQQAQQYLVTDLGKKELKHLSPYIDKAEIEAALDESNVDPFACYLKKMTKNPQFIIITHRRGTMNAADRLYGITMQEKGVSTLVSVDLVENALDK